MSHALKPLESLKFCANPSQVHLGEGTTVQDLINWINYLRYEVELKDQALKTIEEMLRPVPDNVIDLPSKRIEENQE